MSKGFLQKFEFDSYTVVYNPENFSILCKRQPENKNIWIIKSTKEAL